MDSSWACWCMAWQPGAAPHHPANKASEGALVRALFVHKALCMPWPWPDGATGSAICTATGDSSCKPALIRLKGRASLPRSTPCRPLLQQQHAQRGAPPQQFSVCDSVALAAPWPCVCAKRRLSYACQQQWLAERHHASTITQAGPTWRPRDIASSNPACQGLLCPRKKPSWRGGQCRSSSRLLQGTGCTRRSAGWPRQVHSSSTFPHQRVSSHILCGQQGDPQAALGLLPGTLGVPTAPSNRIWERH